VHGCIDVAFIRELCLEDYCFRRRRALVAIERNDTFSCGERLRTYIVFGSICRIEVSSCDRVETLGPVLGVVRSLIRAPAFLRTEVRG
jgi:hypothetical protein